MKFYEIWTVVLKFHIYEKKKKTGNAVFCQTIEDLNVCFIDEKECRKQSWNLESIHRILTVNLWNLQNQLDDFCRTTYKFCLSKLNQDSGQN